MMRLLFLFALGCQAASAAPPARCDVAGDWRANLMIYDGKAHLTVREGDVLELELVGKGKQEHKGRRLDARHLTFDFPSGQVHCEIAPDCKHVACDAPDGHRLFELSR